MEMLCYIAKEDDNYEKEIVCNCTGFCARFEYVYFTAP